MTAATTVRKLVGIGFPGEPASIEWLLGELEVGASPEALAAVAQSPHLRFGPAPHAVGVYGFRVPLTPSAPLILHRKLTRMWELWWQASLATDPTSASHLAPFLRWLPPGRQLLPY